MGLILLSLLTLLLESLRCRGCDKSGWWFARMLSCVVVGDSDEILVW